MAGRSEKEALNEHCHRLITMTLSAKKRNFNFRELVLLLIERSSIRFSSLIQTLGLIDPGPGHDVVIMLLQREIWSDSTLPDTVSIKTSFFCDADKSKGMPAILFCEEGVMSTVVDIASYETLDPAVQADVMRLANEISKGHEALPKAGAAKARKLDNRLN